MSSQASKSTEKTNKIFDQLLDYVAAHPNDGTIYCKSSMQLEAYSNVGYLNENQARIRTSAHIYLSENSPIPFLMEQLSL